MFNISVSKKDAITKIYEQYELISRKEEARDKYLNYKK